MDMSRGYEIKPASEGGFVVCGKPAVTPWGAPPGVTETAATVAFSNAKDLIVWLANSHEVSIAVNMTVDIEVHKPSLSQVRAATENDKFTPWEGGTCPIDRGSRVTVRTSNGDEITGMAGQFAWTKGAAPHDIVAYRLV